MPTPSWTVSFTMPTASNSPAKASPVLEANRTRRLDQPPSPVTQIHRPARLATRAASFRYGGRHHSGIPGDIIPLHPGGFVGIRTDDQSFPSEAALEETFVDRFKATTGMALVACSAQNIDRVVTTYRAAKRTGRTLIVDAYAAEVLKASGHDSIPKPVAGWSNLAVFIPHSQRIQLVKKNIASLVDSYRGFRLWPEQLAENAARSVMLFRGWMMRDLDQAKALSGASVFWSQWDGYLSEGAGAALRADCERRGIPFESIHTSGHASPGDLKGLAAAVAPKRPIPIHTYARAQFPRLFDNVSIHDDGEWTNVGT